MRRRRRPVSASFPSWNIEKPLLQLADLVDPAMFWSEDADGVFATYDDLPATFRVPIPSQLDQSRPFSFGVLFEYHGADQRISATLVDASDTSWKGIHFSVDSTDIRIEMGSSALFHVAPPASGDRVWLGLTWLPGIDTAVAFIIPVPNAQFGDPDAFLDPADLDYFRVIQKDHDGGMGPALVNLTDILVQSGTATSKIISIFARQEDINRGPAYLNADISGDPSAIIRVPPLAEADVKDLVIIFHGQNSSESQGSDRNLTDEGLAVAGLVAAGYITAYVRASDNGDYDATTACNWGSTGPLNTYWKTLIEECQSRYTIRNIYLIGMSMGLMNALNYYHLHPTGIKGIVGISGASNLTAAYADPAFQAFISAAYGGAPPAGFDPTLKPAVYAGNVPIKLWHGDADATLDIGDQMTAFANAVNGVTPGSVVAVSVPGADHLDAACFDAAELLDFLQSNV